MPAMQHSAVELLDLVPDLPSPTQRWTVARKTTVIRAVRGGWVPIEEICELYSISVDEFLAWERDVDRYGVPGLRTTRLQIYRDTEKGAATVDHVSVLRRCDGATRGDCGSRDHDRVALALAVAGTRTGLCHCCRGDAVRPLAHPHSPALNGV